MLAPVVTQGDLLAARPEVAGGVGAGARCDIRYFTIFFLLVAGGVGAGARCDTIIFGLPIYFPVAGGVGAGARCDTKPLPRHP